MSEISDYEAGAKTIKNPGALDKIIYTDIWTKLLAKAAFARAEYNFPEMHATIETLSYMLFKNQRNKVDVIKKTLQEETKYPALCYNKNIYYDKLLIAIIDVLQEDQYLDKSRNEIHFGEGEGSLPLEEIDRTLQPIAIDSSDVQTDVV